MKNVPKLRFKEFKGEWEKIKLKELLEFKNGINASKEQYGKGIKFINVLDILDNDFITYNNIIGKVDIDEKTLEKYSVNYGDILFQRSSETREEVGMANVYLDDKTVTFGGFVIRGKKIANYIPAFINKVLKTDLARNEITSKSGGSTRYNVGQDILNEVQIIIPNLQEQEKIANFLSNVDKKISFIEEKLNLFKEYKKGMMQKIFSQQLRFKDKNGNNYPEWKEIKIGKVLIERKEYSEKSNDFPHLSLTKDGILPKSERYERDFLVKDKEKMYKITRLNDICYNPANLKFGVICKNNLGDGIFSPIYITFIVKKGTNAEYLNLYIKYSDFIKRARKYEEGTVYERMAVKCSDFIKTEIKLPCFEEQQKIADFLSAIDNKIEKISDELENLKEFKKGLLQQMFI